MITVRVEGEADWERVEELHREAFGSEEEPRLVRELRASGAFVPELSLVAEEGSSLVGHILFTKIAIVGSEPDREVPALALAPMAVVPGEQRRGIGSRLVRAGLGEARRLGHGIVVVLGHPEYYPRFGFAPASEHGIRPPFDCPDDAFLVLELVSGALAGVEGVVRYSQPFGL